MATIYELGPFRLDGEAEILFRGTAPVPLGQRAVAVLRALVERAGVLVSKDDLIGAAWPGVAVEESNLTVQIANLRRVLSEHPGGETWIETMQRRGYRYVGPILPRERDGRSGTVHTQPAPPLELPDKPSIAVLPFANLSGDVDQDYFADGVVEDIITGLSRIKSLFVVGRTSSFAYKGKAVGSRQVGQELGVRYLLEGSVRRAGMHLRINTQLVEAETGADLWAERYDRPFHDIFSLQDEITLSVVGAIEPSLREAEITRVKRTRPTNLDAYDLVLRALPHVYTAIPQEALRAMPLLQNALALQADYAGAHGFLAWCHEILFVRAGFREEDRTAAVRHARAAIVYGRDDATALALSAFVIAMVEHDRVTAFEAFQQALALSPSSAFTLILGSVALAYAGEAQRAIDWAERALRVSPFDRLAYGAHQALTVAHFLTGRHEEAANAGRRAVRLNPGFSVSHSLLVPPLVQLGRIEEAKAVAGEVLALQPAFSSGGFCAALALPVVLSKPMTEAWLAAGLPP